jgi:hypothetical protein
MASPDLSQSFDSAKSKINAVKTFNDISKSSKELSKKAGNSLSESSFKLSSQLSQVSDLQKRFQREVKTSTDQLIDLISLSRGNGPQSIKYLRRKILEVVTKIEPEIRELFTKEALKAVGCSQEQTYIGYDQNQLRITPLPLLPQSEGIYIPVQSVDIFSNLKSSPESEIGSIYYESQTPSSDSKFIPFGGKDPYPMNKMLYELMNSENEGRSFNSIFGKNYQGKSLQNIFDIQYTKSNEFGVNGDYFRVALINRSIENDINSNNVGSLLSDYYQTIKLFDNVDIGSQIVNLLSGAIDIKSEIGIGELEPKSKFYLIVERILGLCFDSRKEIDVSGVSKIGELDGVDDNFFKLNEIDLRTIELDIDNIQKGVMEFVDCDNVKLPVDVNTLIQELIIFKKKLPTLQESEVVDSLEQIIDSIHQNREWIGLIPNSFNTQVSIDTSVIKKIPLALASAILSPKVLLPIFVLLSVVKSKSSATYNEQITNSNLIIGQLNNVILNPEDFLKKFRSFSIELISKINEIFLKTLFDVLKKDIINLISIVLNDISNSRIMKKYTIILKLVNLALIVSKGISDYRKCKSLVDEILLLLNLISGVINRSGYREIPIPLLLLSSLLPGTSPERATINVIENLQSLGIPTGVLPDGSPNLMLLYTLATTKGIDKEISENGKVEIVLDPTLPITGIGKFI